MGINKMNGQFTRGTKVSELIEYLNGHKDFYGDTEVIFMIDGEREVIVQFDHFKDGITINLEEDFE